MSFYGTVYHQIIDAFHRLLITNSGKNDEKTFLEDLPEEDGIKNSIAANGRSSVIKFNAGNKWIQFGLSEEGTKVDLYHGSPGKKKDNIIGFELQEEEDEEEYISLNSGDKFKTCIADYDEAGHITNVEVQGFKLPVLDIEQDISTLEENVKNLQTTTQSLQEKTETNKNNIATNKNNLTSITDNIKKDITNINKTIGDMESISIKFDEIQDITLVKAIIELESITQEISNQINTINIAIKGLEARIENLEK